MGKFILKDIEKPGLYHLCSNGMRSDSLFLSEDDFISAMNIIAIAAFQTGVTILAFCVMGNHFHFILNDTKSCLSAFSKSISHRYFCRRKHSSFEKNVCERLQWSVNPIDTEEYLLKAIAYVLKNPVEAHITKMPFDYEWSSISLYFKTDREVQNVCSGMIRLKDMTVDKRREVLRTRVSLPEQWLMTGRGYIWPGSYVNFKEVEIRYKYANRFLYFISSRREAETTWLTSFVNRVAIPDVELNEAAHTYAVKFFNKQSLRDLSLSQRLEIASQLLRDYGSNKKQICRIVHVEEKLF